MIFDLDGTLLNTLEDIAQSMNAALMALGAPTHPVEDYRTLVGRGMEILAFNVLPENRRDPATVTDCVNAMRKEYGRTWAQTTTPYAGITELLALLAERNIKTAVLSNKADVFTKQSVAHFFSAHRFELVLGSSTSFPNKPDPAGALHIASSLGVEPGNCFFIGDSDVDMQTANNAGMIPMGVLWGFRTAEELLANGAKYLVRTPAEILEKL
jgi:phosphoglycolate phosphatase